MLKVSANYVMLAVCESSVCKPIPLNWMPFNKLDMLIGQPMLFHVGLKYMANFGFIFNELIKEFALIIVNSFFFSPFSVLFLKVLVYA